MKYLGRFQKIKDKKIISGLYNFKESKIYPIESIFYPNITGSPFEFCDFEPLEPVKPSKIVAIGKNYLEHVKEFDAKVPDHPIVFLKGLNSLCSPNEKILIPQNAGDVEYEGEITIVIKKEAYKVSEKDAHEYILGFTCANDVTARTLQRKDGQWARAKSFNTFCPIGPWILPMGNFNFNTDLKIKTYLNNNLVQESKSESMIFNISFLISYITEYITLYPGDIILTGTPSGVGLLKNGDTISIEIEGLGKLTNKVTSI